MSTPDSDSTADAADADVQEQERLPLEDGFDPEQTAQSGPPDGARMDADPADLLEQSREVTDDVETGEDDRAPE